MASAPQPDAAMDLDLAAELERVEGVLLENVASDQPMVAEAASYLARAGGKRLRPMLTLLSSGLGDPKDPRIVPCAAAIELTHLASLYHDDVIDETAVRRGVATANERYDNSVAILTGDFLFARASGLAADLGSYVSRRLADTIAELCEGQIMETEIAGRMDTSTDRYLDVIERKTASLIATSCHLGSWLSGADEAIVDAVSEYGRALGIAFQLADDILDVDADEADSGKVPGTDLREGVLTMPALETLAGAVAGADDLRAALDAGDIDRALEILRTNGSLDRARASVASWQERATAALDRVPSTPARDALTGVVAFVGERKG